MNAQKRKARPAENEQRSCVRVARCSKETFRSTRKDAVCERCMEHEELWKGSLTPKKHGCSVCRRVFAADTWLCSQIKRHRYCNTALVCSDCVDRGYAPYNFKAYKCEGCKETFGSRQFEKWTIQNRERKDRQQMKRRASSALLCSQCRERARDSFSCCKCRTTYHRQDWPKSVLKNHLAKQTPLLCTACRARGFHPRNLKVYTCQTCLQGLASTKFDKNLLRNHVHKKRGVLKCLQCSGRADKGHVR